MKQVRCSGVSGATAVFVASLLATAGCGLFSGGPKAPGPLPAPRVTPGDLDARALLGEVPARASRLGAGPVSVVAASEAIENEWTGGFVDVPPDACLLAYARASSSVTDVDISIFSDEGAQLAADEGRDVHPTAVLCTPHPDRVYVAAHVVDGEGLVTVGAQLVPKERATIVARSLGARGGVGEGPGPTQAWVGLDEAVRVHRLALGGVWEEFRRIALPVDASMATAVPVSIDADQCFDVVIVPDEQVTLLEVEAYDSERRVVARSREGPGARTLTLCSPVAMQGSLSVRPHVGHGQAAFVLARAPGSVARDLSIDPDVVWTAAAQPLETVKAAREEALGKRGYELATTSIVGTLGVGRRTLVPLDWRGAAGSCARVEVLAGAPLALIEGRLWNDAGALLASGDSASSLILFDCGRGTAQLELEVRGRPGPFAVTMRAERWKDPALTGHPLAASRMLARAAVGSDAMFVGKPGAVREEALDAQRRVGWDEVVDAGHCVRVAVGTEGEGVGVELRAYDQTEGSDVDRCEGAHAAGVRACAGPEGPRSVRFQLRAGAGHQHAVVGESSETP